jgi:hypothetical protein
MPTSPLATTVLVATRVTVIGASNETPPFGPSTLTCAGNEWFAWTVRSPSHCGVVSALETENVSSSVAPRT